MTSAIVHALLESAWQGVAIAAGLFLLLRLLPQDRARTRYAAALIALAAMLGGFVEALVDGVFGERTGVRVLVAD